MRATVALVETRPETVQEDLDRVLALAGLGRDEAPPSRLVLDAGPAGSWFPGAASTPWQAAAACVRLAREAGVVVHAVDAAGRPVLRPAAELAALLAGAPVAWAGDREWARRPVRPAVDAPLLLARQRGLLTVPAGLHGEPLALLPVPGVGEGWPLAGAVALLVRLLAPAALGGWRGPRAALPVEVVRLARAELHVSAALLDGTLWQVRDRRGRVAVRQGNVLLAGRDPVAVDAVACRLAGADPARVPWLRACAQEGIGAGDPRDVRLVGRSEIGDLGLELPPRVLAPAVRLAPRRAWQQRAWRWLRRPAALRRVRGLPWVRLRARTLEPKA